MPLRTLIMAGLAGLLVACGGGENGGGSNYDVTVSGDLSLAGSGKATFRDRGRFSLDLSENAFTLDLEADARPTVGSHTVNAVNSELSAVGTIFIDGSSYHFGTDDDAGTLEITGSSVDEVTGSLSITVNAQSTESEPQSVTIDASFTATRE